MIYDVAIVGCGPVGALAANLLARAGHSVLVLEREAALHPLARATHLDHEAMRLLQDAGLADAALAIMRETDGHLHVGADRGVIRYMGTRGMPRPYGWANDYFFFQPQLEACLRAGLERYPQVHLRPGDELRELVQDAHGVTLHAAQGTQRARFVIASDGSRSAVRKSLGVALEDFHFEETWLVVDAEVDGDVRFPAIAGLPDEVNLQRLSTMMCDPQRPATIVPGPHNYRRWEFMLLPGEDEAHMMQPAQVMRLVGPWLEGVPHRIVRAATYDFHGLIADRWQVGRVFLAGDAAHQTPPFFGQGMCHGLRDAANLAWKLDLVLRDRADAALLASYQQERQPHVRSVTSAAIEAGRYICLLDPQAAAARDAALRERMKNSPRQTAADLIPSIREGILADAGTGRGERFVQPRLGQTLLDELTGTGWRLFATGTEQTARATALAAQLHAGLPLNVVDVTQLPVPEVLVDWLGVRAARCVLVRPDFYVFGTAAEPESLLRQLAQRLHVMPAAASARPALEGETQ